MERVNFSFAFLRSPFSLYTRPQLPSPLALDRVKIDRPVFLYRVVEGGGNSVSTLVSKLLAH